MKAQIHVTLKTEILDPQGDAVARALHALEFDEVGSVRVGKVIEIEVDSIDAAQAKQRLEQMCKKLLVNPVIEDYQIHIQS